MNLLLSLLDGGIKQIVSATGNNETFYATCLRALKWLLGNPYVVTHLELR